MNDQKKFMTWMTYIGGGFILIYILMAFAFYSRQDAVLFVPGKDRLGAPPAALQKNGPPLRQVSVTTADGLTLSAWFAPPSRAGGKVVMLFPANAEPEPPPAEVTPGKTSEAASAVATGASAMPEAPRPRIVYLDPAEARAVRVAAFRKRGYGIFLCEYRGYGGNSGVPSEEGLYADARAGLAWLKSEGYGASKLVLDGQSLGAGVAVQIALEEPPSALILEAPFTSIPDQVKIRWSMLPVDMLLRTRFDNLAKIGRVKAPLLIVHGANDLVIPIHFAETLFEAGSEPKQMIQLEGAGHQDLYAFGAGEKIGAWLEKPPKMPKKD